MLATFAIKSPTTSVTLSVIESAFLEGSAALELSASFALEGAAGVGAASFLASGVGEATTGAGFFCSATGEGVGFAAAGVGAKTELQLTVSQLTFLRS
jgi:hypothetical protein